MTEKLVFDFEIDIYGDKISEIHTGNGGAVIIPFGGKVESELFTGTILPGAADVQTVDPARVRHMHACYMFEGHDSTGAACKLFVDNNGYFMRGCDAPVFETVPTMMTDSAALQGYLHSARFRGAGGMENGVLHIKIYDICPEI